MRMYVWNPVQPYRDGDFEGLSGFPSLPAGEHV